MGEISTESKNGGAKQILGKKNVRLLTNNSFS